MANIKVKVNKEEFIQSIEWAKLVKDNQVKKYCGGNYTDEQLLFVNVFGKLGEFGFLRACENLNIDILEKDKILNDIPSNKESDFTYDFKNRFNEKIDVKTVTKYWNNLCDNANALERKNNKWYVLVRTVRNYDNLLQMERDIDTNGYIEVVIEGCASKDRLVGGITKLTEKKRQLRVINRRELDDITLINKEI